MRRTISSNFRLRSAYISFEEAISARRTMKIHGFPPSSTAVEPDQNVCCQPVEYVGSHFTGMLGTHARRPECEHAQFLCQYERFDRSADREEQGDVREREQGLRGPPRVFANCRFYGGEQLTLESGEKGGLHNVPSSEQVGWWSQHCNTYDNSGYLQCLKKSFLQRAKRWR